MLDGTHPANAAVRWRLVTLILAILLVAAACGGSSGPGTEGLTVTDALGRTVAFEAAPERITVAGRATLFVVDALYLFPAAPERLVALEMRAQNIEPFLRLVDPGWADIVRLEQNAGAEQIAPTNPDLVMAKSAMAETLGGPLEAVGIKVFYVDFETPEQYWRDLTALGQLIGDPARAQEILAFYQGRVDRISGATADLDEADRPTVLVLQHSEDGGSVAFKVAPASWIQTTLVELAGGVPVWVAEAGGGGWTVVGFEQIAAWDPDQIYVISYSGESAGVVEGLKADPRWQALSAVQAGAIYGFPGDVISWDQPDPRWILGLTWLFTKVQPGLAAGIDIMAEVRAFYEQMYSLDPVVVEAEIISRLFGSLP